MLVTYIGRNPSTSVDGVEFPKNVPVEYSGNMLGKLMFNQFFKVSAPEPEPVPVSEPVAEPTRRKGRPPKQESAGVDAGEAVEFEDKELVDADGDQA